MVCDQVEYHKTRLCKILKNNVSVLRLDAMLWKSPNTTRLSD